MSPNPRKKDIHDPGRRHEELPEELVEANRRAGSHPSTGEGDGTDLAGREQEIDEGMHEPFPGQPRPDKTVRQ